MGGCDFFNVYIGKSSPTEAFAELRENVAHESGHGGYTGTIAEKDSIVLKECPPRKNPFEYAEEIIEENDKWGPAFCIEVKRSFLKKMKDENPHLKGKRGIRGYIFCGIASS